MIVGGGLKCQGRIVLQSASLFEGPASSGAECREQTIIRTRHPREVALNGLGSQRTCALRWTRFRRWPGVRVPMDEFFHRRWLEYAGLSAEEAADWSWTVALHPEDRERLTDYWRQVLASGEAGEIEARLRRYDQEFRWFLFRAEPLRNELGDIIRWCCRTLLACDESYSPP